MTFKVHGNSVLNGDFNRESEYVYVYTAFEMASTGVFKTRAQLAADLVLPSATLSATNNIVIDGVNYTVDGTYDNAYWTNWNFMKVYDAVRQRTTAIAINVDNVAGGGVQLTAQRLPGTATTFGTNMTNTAEGFWYAIFVVESTDTLAYGSQTAVTNIEAALTGTGLFFNTTAADANNEDSMGGTLAVGDAVDGEVSAGDRNIAVAVSNVIVA